MASHRFLQDDNDDATSSSSTPWSGIWVTAVVTAAQSLLFYAFFLWQRRRHALQDNYTLYEPRQFTRPHRSPPAFDNAHWWRAAWTLPDAELLRCVGLDSFMFLRVLWLGVRLTAVGTLLAAALVPIYATGSVEEAQEFNQLTLARVDSDEEWRLYAGTAAWFVFVAVALRLLAQEWQLFRTHRWHFLAQGDLDTPPTARYAALMEQVDPDTINATTHNLAAYLERLFPDQVRSVTPCRETADLEALVRERQLNIEKWEAVEAQRQANPDQPAAVIQDKKLAQQLYPTRMESGAYYALQVQRLNAAIDELREEILRLDARGDHEDDAKKEEASETEIFTTIYNDEDDNDAAAAAVLAMTTSPTSNAANDDSLEIDASELLLQPSPTRSSSSDVEDDEKALMADDSAKQSPKKKLKKEKSRTTSTAFVTFGTLKAKQAAVQCAITGDGPDGLFLSPAADPAAILWSNVTIPFRQQQHRQMLCGAFWCVGILFWAAPVSFITSIANLNGILEALKLKPANPNAAWYGLVSGLLPVVFLAILMAVLYLAIRGAAVHVIRFKSWPQVDAYTFYWHQLFLFANLWLILIGGSLFNQLDAILQDVSVAETLDIIAKALPGAASFFVNLLLVSSLGAFGLELSMLPTHGVQLIMNWIQPEAARTQRQLDQAQTPPSLVWGQQVPPVVFVFLVVFLYFAIVPLLQGFGLVYFTGMYLVFKHQCLHVYAVEFEGGGEATWMQVFPFLMACLYMGEAVFIAYMGIKEAPIPAGLGFVPLIITLLVHRSLQRNLIDPLRHLSLEMAADSDIRDGPLVLESDKSSGGEQQLYLQPVLDTEKEERGPMPYRRSKELMEEGSSKGLPEV